MADLLVIVPSRGRPAAVRRTVQAWLDTGAYADADLVYLIDFDDPEYEAYFSAELPDVPNPAGGPLVRFAVMDSWRPMVHKLNEAANVAAGFGEVFSLGFAGDDHVPRSPGWARRYLEALRELGTGIVYGNDLLQGKRLPTQWAMTADIVRALGRMVPAPVEHLYCDNAILALGREAECIRYLRDVVVEHVHPIARRAAWDDQYRRVNRPEQYERDGAAYREWVAGGGLTRDAATVRALREVSTSGTRR